MAQLKDLLVTGDTRIVGKLYANLSMPDGVFHLANVGGTAAVTTSPYTSSKWYTTIDDQRITSLYSGLTISLKIPVAGHATYGVLLNVNGLGDHPVVFNVNSTISTRYAVGGTIILTYNATQTATGYNNSASATTYTGCWQMEDYNTNDNTIWQLRNNNANCTVASNAGSLYRYEICFTNKNGQLVPYNNTNNAVTTYTKALNSASFDPFGLIYYYNSTTNKTAGADAGASALYSQISFDTRYSFNIQSDGTAGSTALTASKPVYVVATYDEATGLATLVNNTSATSYLDRSSIVQAMPSTNLEGKILIFLGRAYSKYQIEMNVVHPVYKWDAAKNAWMEFTSSAATVNGHTVAKDVPSDAKFTDTTYSDVTTSAHGLMTAADKSKLNYTNVAYGTCSTAAATAAKSITVSGNTNWDMTAGSIICIKFTNTNTASNPTFAVNGKTAKSVSYDNAVITTTKLEYAGSSSRASIYMYDGTNYVWVGWSAGSEGVYPSAYCTTAAGTAAKTAVCTNYSLLNKSYTQVLITTSNTAASALTMNINGKGAKAIYINGTASSATNYTLPAGSYLTYYDGTNYHFRTDGKVPNATSNVYVGTTAPTDPDIEVWVDPSGTLDNSAFINLIYPVGAIYMTVNANDDPNTLFGVGTWVRMKDTFLLGAGDTYTSGDTGGAATVTLATTQIPGHTHSGTTGGAGGHNHNIFNKWASYAGGDTSGNGFASPACSWNQDGWATYNTSDVGNHTHTFTTGSTGGGEAHENMPPYIVVNMWKRTA